MDHLTLRVSGMTCEGCVRTIENKLRSVKGVASATVDLGNGQANVSYEGGRVSPVDLVAAIEKLGFEAQPQ